MATQAAIVIRRITENTIQLTGGENQLEKGQWGFAVEDQTLAIRDLEGSFHFIETKIAMLDSILVKEPVETVPSLPSGDRTGTLRMVLSENSYWFKTDLNWVQIPDTEWIRAEIERAVDISIQPSLDIINALLDTDVVTEIEIASDDDSVSLNSHFRNLSTGLESQSAIAQPTVSRYTAGNMDSAMFVAFEQYGIDITEIKAMLAGLPRKSIASGLGAEPSQQQLASAFNAVFPDAAIPGDGVVGVDTGNVWIMGNGGAWLKTTQADIELADGSSPGLAKHSALDGSVGYYVAGVGQVNGWSDLKTAVAANAANVAALQTAVSANTASISSLQSGKLDKYTPLGEGIDLDTLTVPGIYRVSANMVHSPIGNTANIVFVYGTNTQGSASGGGVQICSYYHAGNPYLYYRIRIGSTFTNAVWRRIVITEDLNLEGDVTGALNESVASKMSGFQSQIPASSNPSAWPTGTYATAVYGNGYPATFGTVWTSKDRVNPSNNVGSTVQLFIEWSGQNSGLGGMWWRNARDNHDGFSAWQRVASTDGLNAKLDKPVGGNSSQLILGDGSPLDAPGHQTNTFGDRIYAASQNNENSDPSYFIVEGGNTRSTTYGYSSKATVAAKLASTSAFTNAFAAKGSKTTGAPSGNPATANVLVGVVSGATLTLTNQSVASSNHSHSVSI